MLGGRAYDGGGAGRRDRQTEAQHSPTAHQANVNQRVPAKHRESLIGCIAPAHSRSRVPAFAESHEAYETYEMYEMYETQRRVY